jgi:Hypervirulence associated proteins TUDOR domain
MAVSKGDKVSWNTSQGKTNGTAVEKKTSDFTFKGQDFKPTDEDPFWIVESEKSGAQAAHKESALDPA